MKIGGATSLIADFFRSDSIFAALASAAHSLGPTLTRGPSLTNNISCYYQGTLWGKNPDIVL